MSTSNPDGRPTPSALAISISSLILGLVAGYFIGSGSSIGLFSSSSSKPSSSSARSKRKTPKPQKPSWPNSYDVTIHPDSSADEAPADDEDEDSDLSATDEDDDNDNDAAEIGDFKDNTTDEVKLILVVRTDLGMTKGKIAAQCGHATLAVYKALLSSSSSTSAGTSSSADKLRRRWENNGQPKIAVQCKSEEELLVLQVQAVSLGLVARVIRDAGRTQIASGSVTVLGVLGPKGVVDTVTGGLKLL